MAAAAGTAPTTITHSSSNSTADARQGKKRPQRERDQDYRGTDSDDVFNGAIKTVQAVVDVSRQTGRVVARFTTMDERPPFVRGRNRPAARESVARLLTFDDDTQLNVDDDYERDCIVRAYCITAKKLQGSQAKIVVDVLSTADQGQAGETAIARTLHQNELYTNMTRAERRFIALVPTLLPGQKGLFDAVAEVVHNPAPPRNNALGSKLAPTQGRPMAHGDCGQ